MKDKFPINEDFIIVYASILVLYSILFIGSALKICYNHVLSKSAVTLRLFLIDILVLLISSSILYTVRIIWCSFVFKYYSLLCNQILDALSASTFDFISLNMLQLWFEMYLSMNISIPNSIKNTAWIISILVLMLLVSINYTLRVSFVFLKIFDANSTTLSLALTAAISFLVMILCVVIGKYCIKYIMIVLHYRIANSIVKRLHIIISAIFCIYLLSGTLAVLNLTLIQINTINLTAQYILVPNYYFWTEILPLTAILVYFKQEVNCEGSSVCIPSVLLHEELPRVNSSKIFSVKDNSFFALTNYTHAEEENSERARNKNTDYHSVKGSLLINETTE